jgi:four helix bundle protein
MAMDRNREFADRMYKFAVCVVRFCRRLPSSREGDVIGRQLLRAGTGMPANYRAAGRARSYADFISKLGVAVEEGDEAVYWLNIVIDTQLTSDAEAQNLRTEAVELLAVCSAAHRTARSRRADRPPIRSGRRW